MAFPVPGDQNVAHDLEEGCLSGLREIEVLFELDEMESFILVPID